MLKEALSKKVKKRFPQNIIESSSILYAFKPIEVGEWVDVGGASAHDYIDTQSIMQKIKDHKEISIISR